MRKWGFYSIGILTAGLIVYLAALSLFIPRPKDKDVELLTESAFSFDFVTNKGPSIIPEEITNAFDAESEIFQANYADGFLYYAALIKDASLIYPNVISNRYNFQIITNLAVGNTFIALNDLIEMLDSVRSTEQSPAIKLNDAIAQSLRGILINAENPDRFIVEIDRLIPLINEKKVYGFILTNASLLNEYYFEQPLIRVNQIALMSFFHSWMNYTKESDELDFFEIKYIVGTLTLTLMLDPVLEWQDTFLKESESDGSLENITDSYALFIGINRHVGNSDKANELLSQWEDYVRWSDQYDELQSRLNSATSNTMIRIRQLEKIRYPLSENKE